MFLRNIFEAIQRTGQGKTAVIGWGRGMGHKGHMMLASSVITQAGKVGGDPYFVVSKTVGKDDPITPDEKIAIYKKVFPQSGHIFQPATDELPDLTRVLQNLNQQGYTSVTVVLGADQVKAFQYLKNYNNKPDKSGNILYSFDNLDVISRQETGDPSAGEEGPRATPMRQVLMDPSKSEQEQFAVWRDAMSPEIGDDEVRDLMMKAKERMTAMSAPKPKKAKGVAEARGMASVNPYVELMQSLGWFMSMNTAKIAQDAIDSAAQQELKTMQQQFNKPIINGKKFADVVSDPTMFKHPKVAPALLKFAYDMLGYIEPRIKKYVRPELQSKWIGSLSKLKDQYRAAVQFTSGQQGVAEGESNAMAAVAKRLTDPNDGKTAKLRAAGDKKRDSHYMSTQIAKNDRTSKDEWGNLKELSSNKLGQYKKAAGADATAADKVGNFKKADKRFSGIVKATKKQFANDEKGVSEGAPIVVAQAPIDIRNPKKAPQPYRNQGDIVPPTKPPSTEKRGVKGRPGQRPMPDYSVEEEKQRLDPSCWKGYKKQGTKMKGDTRVNNCVPVSENVENIMDNLINKIIMNEAIQNNRR